MRKAIYTIIVLLISTLFLKADDMSAIMDSAVSHYKNRDFESAINDYLSVIDKGYEAAELYYNLGNSYYKTNDIPKAILYYERALIMAPEDEDIKFNLDLANKYVVDEIEKLPEIFITSWFRDFVGRMHSDAWALLSVVSFMLALILISLFLYSRSILLKKVAFWFGVISLLFSVTTFFFAYKQNQLLSEQNTAIVFTPSVTVKSSPDESGTDIFLIHEGLKVTVKDELDTWVEIRLPDGNQGWIKAEDIVLI